VGLPRSAALAAAAAALATVVGGAPAAAHGASYQHRDVLADMLRQDSVAELRLPGDGVAQVINSSDPTGANTDYSNFPSGHTPDGRDVLMDVHGAGVVTNLFVGTTDSMTPTTPPEPPVSDPAQIWSSNIRIYVDDNPKPIVDSSISQLMRGGDGFPFVDPLVSVTSGGMDVHAPIPYRKHMVITVAPSPSEGAFFFYDIYYTAFPDARGVRSFDPARDQTRYQALIDRWSRPDGYPYAPCTCDTTVDGTLTLAPGKSAPIFNGRGPGEITAVHLTQLRADPAVVTHPDTSTDDHSRAGEPLTATRIEGRWDDRPRLDVDAPVGAFFGTGFGQGNDYQTIGFGMKTQAGSPTPKGYDRPVETSEAQKNLGVETYSYLPMPYARHGQLWLHNTLPAGGATVTLGYSVTYRGQGISLRHGRLMRHGRELGYFHADEFHNDQAATNSKLPDPKANDKFADLHGHGNYAGEVLNETTHSFGTTELRPTQLNPNEPTYQEGDCMFWVDGRNSDAYGQVNHLARLTPNMLPSISSTGHEECFDGGWYYNGSQNNPTAGVTIRDASSTVPLGAGDYSDEISTFHLYLGDTIAFQNHFLATVEHGTNNTFDHADESGVRFYYLAP